MYFYAREMFRQGKIRLEFKHMGLVGDLTSIRYEVKGDKTVAIESKDSIKKRLGRSPDYGDAFVYGLFADKLAIREPVKVKFKIQAKHVPEKTIIYEGIFTEIRSVILPGSKTEFDLHTTEITKIGVE